MQTPQVLRALTSLRFFAAMWVVLFHYWPNLTHAAMPPLVAKGYLGVELFFTLSGFILCHVYLGPVAEGRFSYLGFLWARLARVYPLHIATLAGVGAMALAAGALGMAVDPTILSWSSLPANLLLMQAWGLASAPGWNHPSWSISAEWFAYLTFPAFAGLTLALRTRPRLAIAAAVAFLFALYAAFQALTGASLTLATIRWGALRIVPCFAFGCALYLGWRDGLVRGPKAALAGAYIFGGAGLVFAQLGAPDAAIVACLGGLILFLASLCSLGKNDGGGRIFVYLGEISYSIYMICVPWKLIFINAGARLFSWDKTQIPPLAWIIFFLSVIPLAAISYHLIERPARDLARRWSPGRLAPSASVA